MFQPLIFRGVLICFFYLGPETWKMKHLQTCDAGGVLAFYKGIAPRLMKISIGQAITFSAYEVGFRHFL